VTGAVCRARVSVAIVRDNILLAIVVEGQVSDPKLSRAGLPVSGASDAAFADYSLYLTLLSSHTSSVTAELDLNTTVS
jgi:hypothetical protein